MAIVRRAAVGPKESDMEQKPKTSQDSSTSGKSGTANPSKGVIGSDASPGENRKSAPSVPGSATPPPKK